MNHSVKNGKLATAQQMKVGDLLTMGEYYLSDSETKEPVQWRVLAKSEDAFLVIAAQCLDWQVYHPGGNVTWKNSDLRLGLETMAEELFSPEEWKLILETEVQTRTSLIQSEEDQFEAEQTADCGDVTKDRLFLLSVYEAARYFPGDDARKCAGTPYAVSKGCYNNGKQMGACWWLRGCGYQKSYASEVLPWGEINGEGDEVEEEGGVRPAMWVRFPKEELIS